MTNSLTNPAQSRPTCMRYIALALALLLSLVASVVHAQDEVAVSDRTVRSNTSDIKNNTNDIKNNTNDIKNNTGDIKSNTKDISNQLGGSTSSNSSDTVNGHLKNIDTLGNAPATLSTVAAPADAINPDKITMTAQGSGAADPCTALASAQQEQCQHINSAKLARFNYMKAMYDNTLKLQQTLTDLQKARQNIGSEEYGKLQDNSNQLLAVIAQLQIDRQQMESVNHAYESYIADQQNQQIQEAKAATAPGSAGGSPISNVASSIIGGAILQGALSVESSGSGSDHQLSIEQ